MNDSGIVFCTGGGCTAKLGPAALKRVLENIPKTYDENLLVGYEASDDAAVYKVSDDLAIVQTMDFFPPMVDDPYIFGQIAAANALSDIYAMGGDVKTALNIVCFPERMNLDILGEIILGGSEKVKEAGGVLAGGHSIADDGVKYGLSVNGVVHPQKIFRNNTCSIGDKLILTKTLGVGIVTTANRVGEASKAAMDKALASMTTLNRRASETLRRYDVHAVTDVTGFSFLGHLHEMMQPHYGAVVYTSDIPFIEESYAYAGEFLLTAAAQRNRNFLERHVRFEGTEFPMQEILYDPQTSGGLLASVAKSDAERIADELDKLGFPCSIVGEITAREDGAEIIVL